jgi:hypothetical protein
MAKRGRNRRARIVSARPSGRQGVVGSDVPSIRSALQKPPQAAHLPFSANKDDTTEVHSLDDSVHGEGPNKMSANNGSALL